MDGARAVQILRDLITNWKATTEQPKSMVDPVSAALVLKGLELACGSLTTEIIKERLPITDIMMNSLNGGPVKAAGYNEEKQWLRIQKSDGSIEDYHNIDPYYFYNLFRSGDPYQFYVENIQSRKENRGEGGLII
jgi:hypothetical protein